MSAQMETKNTTISDDVIMDLDEDNKDNVMEDNVVEDNTEMGLDDTTINPMITLVSKDNQKFEVLRHDASISWLISGQERTIRLKKMPIT